MLASALAADFHKQSLSPRRRQLAYQSLIIGRPGQPSQLTANGIISDLSSKAVNSYKTPNGHQDIIEIDMTAISDFNEPLLSADIVSTYSRPQLLKVDPGGNIYRCQAIAIGHLSERLNLWLTKRGAFIAQEITASAGTLKYNQIEVVESNDAAVNATVSKDSDDVSNCLDIIFHCIKENVPSWQNRLFNDSSLEIDLSIEISVMTDTDYIRY